MQIIIKQHDIETAIRNFIEENVSVGEDNRIDIDIQAKRGDEGFQAYISIVNKDAPEPVKKTPVTPASKTVVAGGPKKAPSGRRPGPKPKPRDAEGNIIRDEIVGTETVVKQEPEHKAPVTDGSNNAYVDTVVDPQPEKVVAETISDETSLAQEALATEPVDPTITLEEAKAESPAQESTDTAPRQSLFSNLRKPQNS